MNSRAEFPIKVYHSSAQKQCLEIFQCPEIYQNHFLICHIDIKNLIDQKRPKKAKFHSPFFKNKKSLKRLIKVKNYKFGLRKAKLATLL